MAILKDLIVHGSSRFLNKIYANELEVSAFEAESAIIKKLTAKDTILGNATVIGLLDVQGQLHTNTWTNSNIATIDGCFYITPTLSSDSGNIVFSSVNVANLTGDFTAVNSLYIGDSSSGSTVQWTKDSKILLTGEVEVNGQWLPLGTLLGTLSENAATSSIGLKELKDNRHNDSSIIIDIRNAVSNTSLNYRNLKISLYQRKDGTDSKPLGIYMTAMGANGKTFIDIYGGVNATTTAGSSGGFADPNLRIGNLSGLGAVEGTTPTGWGIYTTNGYFKGVIVSSAGKIGGFDIGTSSIKNTKTSYSETTNNGVWVGTDGIGLGKGLFYVTNAGALTAKSGSIAGWSFNTTSLYKTNATPGYNTSTMVISTGTASTNNIGGGGTTSKTWMISAGTGFGVTTAGALYCNNAHISGEITATSGTIGGASITDGTLTVPAAQVSGKLTAATIDGTQITANTITADQIATGAIKTDELDANAVTSAKIKAGEVKADNIATDAVTAIKIQAGAVTADKLDATTINASKKITVGALTAADQNNILNSNIQIGGTNLLKNSDDLTKWGKESGLTVTWDSTVNMYKVVDTSHTSSRWGIYQDLDIKPNTTYTFSIWGMKSEDTGTTSAVGTFASSLSWPNTNGSTYTTTMSRSSVTFTSGADHVKCRVYLYLSPTADNSKTGYFYRPKLEEGNKTTDWSPAPEDIDVHKYITDIDSNKGITIKPSNSSGNDYLQINSSAITTYKNNTDVMSLGNNSFRMGTASGKHTTVDSNGLHIWIGSESTSANEVGLFGSTARIGAPASSRFLLNANSLQAYNSSNVKYFEVSVSGLSFGGNAVAKASDIPTTVSQLTDSGNYLTTTVAANTYATQTAANNAAQTASKYITAIDQNGIKVHAENNPDNNYTSITADGMSVYQDIDGTAIEVASFGSDGAKIGKEASNSFTVFDRGIIGSNSQGADIFILDSEGNTSGTVPVQTYYNKIQYYYSKSGTSNSHCTIIIPDNVSSGSAKLNYERGYSYWSQVSGKVIQVSSSVSQNFTIGTALDHTITFNTYAHIHFVYDGNRTIEMTIYSDGWSSNVTSYDFSPNFLTYPVFIKMPALTFGTRGDGEIGGFSICFGENNIGSGYGTAAIGVGNIASGDYQTAIGKYNIADQTSLFIIGNGNQSTRSNALTVSTEGNLNIAGTANIGGNTSITGSLSATGSITQNGTAVSLDGHTHSSIIVYEDVTVSITYAAGNIGTRGTQVNCGTTARSGYKYIGASVLSHTNTSTFSVNLIRNDGTTNLHLMVYRANGNAVTDAQVTIRKTWIKNEFASAVT